MHPPAFVSRLATTLLDIAPLRGLRKGGALPLSECLGTTPRLSPLLSEEHTEGISAPFAMVGVAREAVHRLKYNGLRALAAHMAGLMAQHLQRQPVGWDVVVPVRVHSRRRRQRGYNQADLLVVEVGRELAIPVEPHGLLRVRSGPPQASSASRKERRINVVGAFRATRSFDD